MLSLPYYQQVSAPFSLSSDKDYLHWRGLKMGGTSDFEPVDISDICELTSIDKDKIVQSAIHKNFCLFRCLAAIDEPEKQLSALGKQLGLLNLDNNLLANASGLTQITVKQTATDKPYIPYTDKPLGWHTDGYYNPPERQINGMLLFCVNPAAQGGDNHLVDHELAYIRIRDENPEWIRALSQPDAFTIPHNIENGVKIRDEQSGPVFSINATSGALHMRYSARQRNVIWKDDSVTQEAAAYLLKLFAADDEHIYHHKFAAGEGIICNNILHSRSRFINSEDTNPRLFYRARYYNRIHGT